MKIYFLLPALLLLLACDTARFKNHLATHSKITFSGRTGIVYPEAVALAGSASSASIRFGGDSCVIYLRNSAPAGNHNYFAVELDGIYIGRFRVEGDSIYSFPFVAQNKSKTHLLKIYKASEAANGNICFHGISCKKLFSIKRTEKRKVEFIGNSITSGFGADYSEIPCNSGEWYDQHNAYYAYGPVLSRMLDVDYMLSSVSGIGIYRNWNTEEGAVMPMVYGNTYLDPDTSIRWDFTRFSPDIVSICLGTNDFSDGDGINPRLPFDDNRFTQEYIAFVDSVFNHYPKARVTLLSSPMLTGEKSNRLVDCLKNVQAHFAGDENKSVSVFVFNDIIPNGCGYHPDIQDMEQMANQLYPFFREMLEAIE